MPLRVRLPPAPMIFPANVVLMLVWRTVSAPMSLMVGVAVPVPPIPVLLASGPMVWLKPLRSRVLPALLSAAMVRAVP